MRPIFLLTFALAIFWGQAIKASVDTRDDDDDYVSTSIYFLIFLVNIFLNQNYLV